MNKTKDKIEGEGSYTATADYNGRTAEFLKKGKVDGAARDAAKALDSEEAPDPQGCRSPRQGWRPQGTRGRQAQLELVPVRRDRDEDSRQP